MRSITIQTTQHVDIEYELASPGIRVLAFIIDCFIVALSYMMFALFFLIRISIPEILVFFFLPLSCFLAYYFLSEMLMNGRTIGKKILHIRVLRVDGKAPTPSNFSTRALFLLPDAWFSLAIPGIVLMNTSPKAQRLGDMVAGTVVVNERNSYEFTLEDIRTIKSINDYQPRFPMVKHFDESDMLLIKHSIKRHENYKNAAHQALISELATHCRTTLNIENEKLSDLELLTTLLKDYIVLTR